MGDFANAVVHGQNVTAHLFKCFSALDRTVTIVLKFRPMDLLEEILEMDETVMWPVVRHLMGVLVFENAIVKLMSWLH